MTYFDVIIIGAGINGAGIARDASMRGLSVLLLDKGDIGGGTSSWSTRLIHGGLRYLEHGEIGLVHQSLRERETLLHIAPHLVRDLPILVPVYGENRRGMARIRVGMFLYDLLSRGKSLARHEMLSRAEALAKMPGLNPDGLTGAALYHDAQVEFAERLVLENVLAARESGAIVITYAQASEFVVEEHRLHAVRYVEKHTGEVKTAAGRIVVNAAGPWVDQLLQLAGPPKRSLIGGTKGTHIIVPGFIGAPSQAIYVEAQTDHRPFFIIPWNSNYLIGTTDTRFEGNLDEVWSEPGEVDYLLDETNRVFPGARLTRDTISYTYSGVRPLPCTGDHTESEVTRRHFIREHPELHNLLSIVGGKLTTHRSLAEECVNLIYKKLGRETPECTSASVPLPGGVNFSSFVAEFKNSSELTPPVNNRLVRIYGSRAVEIARLCQGDATLDTTFNKAGDALAAEVVFSFETEMAQTLADCLLRRTMLGLNSDRAIGDDERAATVGQRVFGWTADRAKREVVDYRAIVHRL